MFVSVCKSINKRDGGREWGVLGSLYSLMRLRPFWRVCACVLPCLLAELGKGRDRLTERGREGKKDRRDQMRERKAECRAPPHSPTFLWKSSQTTAIGGEAQHRSAQRHSPERWEEERK